MSDLVSELVADLPEAITIAEGVASVVGGPAAGIVAAAADVSNIVADVATGPKATLAANVETALESLLKHIFALIGHKG